MKINHKIISRKTLKQIETELNFAEKARLEGNSGRERVAARRAVGVAIQAFYSNREVEFTSPASFDAVRFMIDDSDISDELRKLLPHFVQRLVKDSPDEDSYWPLDTDIIEEARQVVLLLSNQE